MGVLRAPSSLPGGRNRDPLSPSLLCAWVPSAGPDRAQTGMPTGSKGIWLPTVIPWSSEEGNIEGSGKGQEGAREESPSKFSIHSPCGADLRG